MFCKLFTKRSPKKNIPHVMHWLIICLIASIFFANELPIRINQTSSMPHGIYFLKSANQIHAGDFVMICLNRSFADFAVQRGYLNAGNCDNGEQPLLKQVVALAGDTVTISRDYVRINNKFLPHSATLSVDKHGRAMLMAERGIYTLKSNQLWVYGTESARSWDSRYFGIIDFSRVVNTVKPLFIWSEG